MLNQKGFSGLAHVFFRKPFSQKGFLGPIGDDLPSLIPLVFALMIFFAVFYLTFNVFNDRTKDFDNDTSAVQISAALRGAGYIDSVQQFTDLCKNINVKSIDYFAGIIKAENYNSSFIEFSDFYSGYHCTSIEGSSPVVPTRNDATKTGLQLIQKIYPVAVNINYSTDSIPDPKITPAFLVVTVWRGN